MLIVFVLKVSFPSFRGVVNKSFNILNIYSLKDQKVEKKLYF